VEKGLELCGISPEAVDVFAENMVNFMLPSVFTFIKKLLPAMQ
jgi:hypothetical protein